MNTTIELSFHERLEWEKAVRTGVIDRDLLRVVGRYIDRVSEDCEHFEHELKIARDELRESQYDSDSFEQRLDDEERDHENQLIAVERERDARIQALKKELAEAYEDRQWWATQCQKDYRWLLESLLMEDAMKVAGLTAIPDTDSDETFSTLFELIRFVQLLHSEPFCLRPNDTDTAGQLLAKLPPVLVKLAERKKE